MHGVDDTPGSDKAANDGRTHWCVRPQIFGGLDHLHTQALAMAAIVLKGLPPVVAEAVVITCHQFGNTIAVAQQFDKMIGIELSQLGCEIQWQQQVGMHRLEVPQPVLKRHDEPEAVVVVQDLTWMMQKGDDQGLLALRRSLLLEEINQQSMPAVHSVKHAYRRHSRACGQAVRFA